MKVTDCRVQLYLPREIYLALKATAHRSGVTISGFIRELLRQSMGSDGSRPTDPLIALASNRKGVGPRDGSRHVDKYLYGSR